MNRSAAERSGRRFMDLQFQLRCRSGRVLVLLDTFITRLEVAPGRTPFAIKDLVDLAPGVILIGHGHFDHAENAAYLAGKTGATLHASEETCGVLRSDFERISQDPVIQNDPVARSRVLRPSIWFK